jgi:putative spermidine/putrescine transport system permease protein
VKAGRATPYALSAPVLALFALMVLLPLALTALLSFQRFSHDTGVMPGFTLAPTSPCWATATTGRCSAAPAGWQLLTTLICVAIGAPEAYILSRMRAPWRSVFLLVILAPLLVSVVVRAFGWSLVLGPAGFVNQFFEWVGIGRVRMLYTPIAVVVALVHVMLPFMVIPVWTSLQKLDPMVENAALSLGASRFTVLRRVVLPQVTPGLLSGGLIVFALSASALAIPGLLGGRRLKMVATLIYDEYLHELNWPLGAAIALALLVVNLLVMLGMNAVLEGRYRKADGRHEERSVRAALPRPGGGLHAGAAGGGVPGGLHAQRHAAGALGRLVTALVPRGVRTQRPGAELLEQPGRGGAGGQRVGAAGGPRGAGHRAPRVPRAPGLERVADEPADRAAPGAGRGDAAAVRAAGRARLVAVADAGPRRHRHALCLALMVAALTGLDRSIEQAALSLGASRWTAFRRITLPLMLPGVTGGWMLAFINSFDEVTMSIFITSPQTVTLPVRMYMLATESIDPMMAAVSALIVALTAAVMIVLDRLYGLDKVLVGQK